MEYIQNSERQLDLKEINRAIELAFAEHGAGVVQMPPKVYITLPQGDFRTMPAYLPGQSIAGVKVVSVYPDNPAQGIPTVMALTLILDLETGRPIALLNATALTDLRTGAAGAIACKYLSPKRSVILGLVGTGRQALAQVRAISQELRIEKIKAWSRHSDHVLRFAAEFPDLEVENVRIETACDSDILVTTTPTHTPIVKNEWISDGTHINAIGADAPGKEELDPELLLRGRVFVDDLAQAIHSGEINVPITKGIFRVEDISGTLGEVVIGKKRRAHSDEITIFDSTGLAIQDLAIARLALKYGERFHLPFIP